MESNFHHFHWTKREFNAFTLSSHLRNHHSSGIEMPVSLHNDLHAEVEPIRPPTAFVARQALQSLDSGRYGIMDSTRYLIDDMYALGAQYHDDATEMANHLSAQMPFLMLGVKALKRRSII